MRKEVLLKDILTWKEFLSSSPSLDESSSLDEESLNAIPQDLLGCDWDKALAEKVSLYQGDSTRLEVDAIVNAANTSLRGGGGIDGAIHRAAGRGLLNELIEKYPDGCKVSDAVLTGGHNLPSKYVIHTVGPYGEKPSLLRRSYENVLNRVEENGIRSVAFCSVSTGVYGYPIVPATHVALSAVKRWLGTNGHADNVDRIIFVVFSDISFTAYSSLMRLYFPVE